MLVDVLATLAISAAILASLGSLLGLMSRQADFLAVRTERLDVSERSLAAMARDIGFAARARWAGPRRPFVFSGRSDRILFAMDRVGASGLPETVAVMLQSASMSGGAQVLRAEAVLSPLMTGIEQLDFGPSRSLYEGGASVRFAFALAGSAGAPEILIDDWPADDTLPTAVRIAFVDPATGDPSSSLRVPLLIEAEPGCAAPKKAFCSRVDDRSPPDPEDEPSVTSVLGTLHLGRR